MKKSMRLQFNEGDLKINLETLSKEMEISLNQLVNMICSAQFSDIERKTFQLARDISEYKKIVQSEVS